MQLTRQTGRPAIGSGRRPELDSTDIDPTRFQGPVPAHLIPAPPRPQPVSAAPVETSPLRFHRHVLPEVKLSAPKPGGVRCPQGCIPAPRSHGKSRNGSQRWRCTTCLTTWTDSNKPRAGNQLTAEKVEALRVALLEGNSVRASARIAGVSKDTAALYAEGRTVKCPCGKDASHRGWCSWRVAQSPRRQRTLSEMRGRAGSPTSSNEGTP